MDSSRSEQLLSRILRFGVLLSSLLMAAGLLMALLRSVPLHAEHPTMSTFFRQIFSENSGSTNGSSAQTFMLTGLMLLMLTPFGRVLTTLVLFWQERDWKFVGVALLVFMLLVGQILSSLWR
jgi:uncharacterized membrane protein